MKTYTFRTLPNGGHITVQANNDRQAFDLASAEADLKEGVERIEFYSMVGGSQSKDNHRCSECGTYISTGMGICRGCAEVMA